MSSTRSGGRSAVVRARVLAATRELVLAHGAHNVRIPEIAQRAGVAATSIYRRWGDVSTLLLDMAVERLTLHRALPDEGSLEGDLKRWGSSIALGVNAAEEPTFLRILFATSDVAPEKRLSMLTPRLEQIDAMLERGRARGEKTPALEAVIDHLLAPLYMRALLGLQVDETLAGRLVDRLLDLPA